MEAAGVHERGDALSDGEFACVAVAGDAFLATEAGGQFLSRAEFAELGFPDHGDDGSRTARSAGARRSGLDGAGE